MKFKKIQLSLLLIALYFSLSAQEDRVLMVVNNDSIYASEFLRVYNKNLDLVKDANQKDIDNYLELFTDYQLKLNEARTLGLDKDQTYQREFESYKQQLIKSYLAESEVTQELVQEAYSRLKYDVRAVHILVRLDENAKDTVTTYNRLLDYKSRLENEEFESLRAELHNGKTVFVEDLGYFTAFRMVYPFESKAFNTEVGLVSEPFRTQFGYHVVKVLDKRPSRGTITAAHIMVALQQEDSTIVPEQRINLIYQKLEQGESFEDLAKQFSDDKASARKGGELRPFKSGELSAPEFEEAVFEVENEGEYSKPFKTKFGWHIVKRINVEALGEFEDMEKTIQTRVKRDSRSKVINEAMVSDLLSKYDVYEDAGAKDYFLSILNDTYFEGKYTLPKGFSSSKTLFSFNEKAFTYMDFSKYILNEQRNYFKKSIDFSVLYDKLYKAYFEASILQFREDNLVNESPEFAAVLDEYRDGLLLFELMENEVWNKAAKDSVGLKAYYQGHSDEYLWKKRVSIVMASSPNKKNLKAIDKSLMTAENLEQLKLEESEKKSDVIFTSGIFEVDDPVLPSKLKTKKGDVSTYKHNSSFHLIKILEVFPSGTMTFEEARIKVTNDYQAELEQNWINGLKNKYPVWIDQEVFNDLKVTN